MLAEKIIIFGVRDYKVVYSRRNYSHLNPMAHWRAYNSLEWFIFVGMGMAAFSALVGIIAILLLR